MGTQTSSSGSVPGAQGGGLSGVSELSLAASGCDLLVGDAAALNSRTGKLRRATPRAIKAPFMLGESLFHHIGFKGAPECLGVQESLPGG